MPRLQAPYASGVAKQVPGEGIALVNNMRYDQQKRCWSNDRSWVEYLHPDTPTAPKLSSLPVNRVYYWAQKNTLVFEEYDSTNEEYSLKARKGATTYTIDTDRKAATTAFIPVQDKLLIMNGVDRPLMYSGEAVARAAFFTTRPLAPTPMSLPGSTIHIGIGSTSEGTFKWGHNYGGGHMGYLPDQSSYGLGPVISTRPSEVLSEVIMTKDTQFSTQYAVAFVTDTNSESPVSLLSNTVSTKTLPGVLTTMTDGNGAKVYIPLTDIPTGPPGTLRRRLYRTKNQKNGTDGGGAQLFYLTDLPDNSTTIYVDAIPDSSLGSQGPSVTDSITLSPTVFTGTVFKNHLIVSDGDQLFVSEPGRPEQFNAFSYFNVNGATGSVTAIVADGSYCYIFRERGIDVLVPTDRPQLPFELKTLTTSVGCLNADTIKTVPRLGLMFLSSEKSFYSLSGTKLSEESDGINEDLQRVSTYETTASAAYSPRDREYWCTVPIDGKGYNTVGFVYHVDVEQWSVRTNIPCQSLTTLPQGWLAFGSNAGLTSLPSDATSPEANNGVMVWCGGPGGYYELNGQTVERTTGTFDFTYETEHLSFGDVDVLKHVKRLTLYGYATKGTNTATFEFDYQGQKTASFEMLSSDTTNPSELGVTVVGGGTSEDIRTYRQNMFVDDELVSITIDVPEARWSEVSTPTFSSASAKGTGACYTFKFKLSGTNIIDLIGYSIEYSVDGKDRTLSQGTIKAPVKTKRF